MFWSKLALYSFWFRRRQQWLTLIALTATLLLWLAVSHIRESSREHFVRSVSGVDLIVGSRGGGLNLLLYSVFRIGNPTNEVRWTSLQPIIDNPRVQWAVPIQLGDSYRGFRVVGTSVDYFQYVQYANRQPLTFAQGQAFVEDSDQVVLGAEVARRFGHQLGDHLVITHGLIDTRLADHGESPLQVVGVLARTGTPIDQSVHVSMAALDRMHGNWQTGTYVPGSEVLGRFQPQQVTALMLGLESRLRVFEVQRAIARLGPEPLMAILPGATLAELWQMMAIAEQALAIIAYLVLGLGLLAVLAQLSTGLETRRQELWLLRTLGLRPWQMVWILLLETLALSLLAVGLAVGLLSMLSWLLQDWLLLRFSILMPVFWPTVMQWWQLGAVLLLALLLTLWPAMRAYRQSQQQA